MPSRFDEVLRSPFVLALLWAGAVTAMALAAGHFWIPLDDGTLAQSAERVLNGELPQRDFGDPYSGLGAMLGALAFRLFGVRLPSLRVPLVVGFALWLPGLWLIARRFAAPATAAGAVVLAALLSVPTYPAAMPTWFALYAVTWALWCLLRFLDSGDRAFGANAGREPRAASRGWLVAAGALAAVAVLFKVVGLYFVAAALLSLAANRADGSRAYSTVALLGILAFLTLLGRLVVPGTGASGLWHFFVPSLAVGAAVVWRARTDRGGPASGIGPLVADGLALTLGLALPTVIFLIPYVAGGGMEDWVRGVFLLPGRRLQAAASPPGPLWTIFPGVAAIAVAWIGTYLRGRPARVAALALAALLAVGLALDDVLDGGVMAALWYALRGWIPALAVWGAVAWGLGDRAAGRTAPGGAPGGAMGPAALAVVAAAALWTLVEFPYTAPAYFFYVAPLGVLATLAVAGSIRRHAGPVLTLMAAVAAFLGAGYGVGVARSGTTPLDVPRGGLRVSAADADVYKRLVRIVHEHVGGGGLYAGPDAPEVYYLTGLPNPTPTLYEFLDAAPRTRSDLATLVASHDVRVVVLNGKPLFSPPVGADVVAWLNREFPGAATVGPFSVRWKVTP